MLVRDVMTRNPYHVSATDTVEKAVSLMSAVGIRHLLVVDRGILVGIVSENDCPKYIKPMLKVIDIMTTNPITVQEYETVERAREIMISNEIKSLPVLENKSVVGIVTLYDLH